jgi:hypothetical protein
VAIQINDVPDPGVDELQQRPPELWAPVNVPVEVQGLVRVLIAPNRTSSALETTIATGDAPSHVLGDDPARACATLIGSAAWKYYPKSNGAGVRWPADVPLVITHHGPVWVGTTAETCIITCIAENHAD